MTNDNHISDDEGKRDLDALFDRGLANRLTLIVGPHDERQAAALAEWIEQRSVVAITVRRPDGDNESACLRRLIDAFTTAGIVADETLDETPPTEQEALILLLNRLSTLDRDIVLILENYTPSESSDGLLTFLLEHLPNQLHMYLCCEDPPALSCIPRLRVRRQLQTINTAAI